ncbi:MAG: DNA alkylation repair protein [Alkalibacterium sp.]|nr:DNA alkylation repair protein [Alkalibacterium sp.]
MNKNELMDTLVANRNSSQAVQMEKYMRNQFSFLGIQSVKRRKLAASFLAAAKTKKNVDWQVIDFLWNQPYRECQYIACDYLNMMKTSLTPDDIAILKKLALKKSWWDTIDSLDKVVGTIAKTFPSVNDIMMEWSTDSNIWLRRIAINHQRLRKEAMNTALLEAIIINNFNTDEFFINKAIGWILRDYSKTDPEWVNAFISKYKDDLHPLSIREGIKYLPH